MPHNIISVLQPTSTVESLEVNGVQSKLLVVILKLLQETFKVIVGSNAAPANSVSDGVVAASVAPAAEEKKEELEESDDDISDLFR
ncbi:hypothetical protein FRX31_017143 [Thalictrum thalictroides]|uniref:Uncharacterized protein n=1 Tax=Thalictrum thalictroides TaxID=46969 RepID=A0A7J6W9K3_THATH|nr:hypothetical protein FRX31_017143 [Thalictrum thalictroides]